VDLLGRHKELAELSGAFASGHRLVTLEGAPGVGKTHLARAFADPIDALWVDLRAVQRPMEIEDAVARALGWTRGPRDDLSEMLQALGGRVLVLDNFEQVIEARALVERWLAGTRLQILVTSREPLGLAAETVVPVLPLTIADAVALFARGATLARRSFRLEAELGPVTELVERLGRLPLAIELASAWCDALSVEDIRAQVRGSMALIAPLEAALEASLARLTDEDRACFVESAIFAGSFTLVDLAAVLGDPPDLAQSIARLCRKKLLEIRWHGADARYGFLAVIRTFASSKLKDSARLVERHRDHFLRAPLRPEHGAELLAAYDRASDRAVRAVLALHVDALLYDHGPFDRHLPILDEAVSSTAGDVLARALHARARSLRVRGRTTEAWTDLERAAGLADGSTRASVLRMMGVIARHRGLWDRAADLLTQSLEISDEAQAMRALDDLGIVSLDRGDLAQAEQHHRAALALASKLGDQRYRAIATAHVGLSRHLAGDLARSRALYQEALELHRASADHRFEAWTLGFFAYLAFEEGAFEEAAQRSNEALALVSLLGDPRTRACLEGPRIAELIRTGEVSAAITAIGRAREGLDPPEDGAQLAALDRLEATVHGSAAPAALSVELALVYRLLPRLERSDSTLISAGARWFERPETGRVSLVRRRPLQRILARLIEERSARPGRGIEWPMLVEAGWPGERVLPKAGARRVYVAIASLRKLGLDAAILRSDEGYYLADAVQVIAEI